MLGTGRRVFSFTAVNPFGELAAGASSPETPSIWKLGAQQQQKQLHHVAHQPTNQLMAHLPDLVIICKTKWLKMAQFVCAHYHFGAQLMELLPGNAKKDK